jgi:hypothetical protein
MMTLLRIVFGAVLLCCSFATTLAQTPAKLLDSAQLAALPLCKSVEKALNEKEQTFRLDLEIQ